MEDDTTKTGQEDGLVSKKANIGSKKATVVSISSRSLSRSRPAKLVSLSQVYDFKPGAAVDDQALPWEKPFEGLHEELRRGLAEGLRSGLMEDPKSGSELDLQEDYYGEFYDELRDSIIDTDLETSKTDSAHAAWRHKATPAASVQESFYHAFNGMAVAFKNQRNMRIHCCLAAVALTLALLLRVETWGLVALILVCGFVIFAEMVNTAIEHMVDIQANYKYHLSARYAKDTAAAAVLVASIVAVLVGALVILPRIWQLFGG